MIDTATSLPASSSQKAPGVELVSRAELAHCGRWKRAFFHERKDHRYYEIVEDTIRQGFDYRYFLIRGGNGSIRAIQPCFILDQDLLQGAGQAIAALGARVRQLWPRFMRTRTLMVGCVAGEGHIDADIPSRQAVASSLASVITGQARELGASLVVLKEFPARYRPALTSFVREGFTCMPSMPMTHLNIAYESFDEYMSRALSSKTRMDLRKKFRIASRFPPIDMKVVQDIRAEIDEVYPLYLSVYERSKLRFEKLTKDYFCRLGEEMPDKVRYFIWRQNGRIIAFSLCMVDGESIYAEYLGLDYTVALDLHLYHYVFRDVVVWAMANGYKSFRSSGLNYEPKLHLKSLLDPLDLYVRHTSRILNPLLKALVPLLQPTRSEHILQKFPNFPELRNPWQRIKRAKHGSFRLE
jgi:Peptidogalycan biosysnthesis/recognition